MNIYDLIASGVDPQAVIRGLSPQDAARALASWSFNARPGQRWTPGKEFVTHYIAGRGYGKNAAAANAILDAAEVPERWGGVAIVVGASPSETLKYCIVTEGSAILPLAKARAKAGLGDYPTVNLNNRLMAFPAPRGGGQGLIVQWAASSDPKSVRGGHKGLAWLDEFGVHYHRKTDEQGTNAWQALVPSIRARPDPKIIITETPSRAPEVMALHRDAERPECPTCRASMLSSMPEQRYRGAVGQEPWRLPTSPQVRLHPLLDTRTSVVERECPLCHSTVIATVRSVFGSTLDNPFIADSARARATSALATNTTSARMEFAPRGEQDASIAGALVNYEHVRQVEVNIGPGLADRWLATLNILGARDTIVAVDPAVTATADSDDTGVMALCRTGDLVTFGLQDASVHPDEVDGAPSSVWAPRAYWLALMWGASRIIVETNQGGDEVVSALHALLTRPPTEAHAADHLLGVLNLSSDAPRPAGFTATVRRLLVTAAHLKIETVSRRSDKPVRWGWYGDEAANGRQALACLPWLDGARHWAPALAQLTGYEPERTGTGSRSRRLRKDLGDVLISGAQVLAGVRETSRGVIVDPQASGWMSQVDGDTLR